jgi:hypothetical protein
MQHACNNFSFVRNPSGAGDVNSCLKNRGGLPLDPTGLRPWNGEKASTIFTYGRTTIFYFTLHVVYKPKLVSNDIDIFV